MKKNINTSCVSLKHPEKHARFSIAPNPRPANKIPTLSQDEEAFLSFVSESDLFSLQSLVKRSVDKTRKEK